MGIHVFKIFSAIISIPYMLISLFFIASGILYSAAGGFSDSSKWLWMGVLTFLYSTFSCMPIERFQKNRLLLLAQIILFFPTIYMILNYIFAEMVKTNYSGSELFFMYAIIFGVIPSLVVNIVGSKKILS